MQSNNQVKSITIPITRSKLCPVSAISNLVCLTPRGSNLPMFQVKMLEIEFPLPTVG